MAVAACSSSTPCPVCPEPRQPASRPPVRGLTPEDLALLHRAGEALPIVERDKDSVPSVLRQRARVLGPGDAAHLALLERCLRASLQTRQNGVGLAAPQVGLGVRAVVVMLDARSEHRRVQFFANPRIVERSDETAIDYEGCLSVPDVCGAVRRNRRVVIEHGLDGEPASRLVAEGFDARIFQHELDHLDGVLYIDRVEGPLQPASRIRELREKLRNEQPELAFVHRPLSHLSDAVLL